MKDTNRTIFDELPAHEYLKSAHKAQQVFKGLEKFGDAVGFDEVSEGFIAVHRHHAAALDLELPVCIVLKRLGFGILLLEESAHQMSPDAQIDGKLFEIKQIAHAKNLKSAVRHQFRTAYKKSERLLLHIDQPAQAEQLRGAVYAAAKQYPSIKTIWVVKSDRLFQFDRDMVLKGRHQFK